jgi:hypothetical protein
MTQPQTKCTRLQRMVRCSLCPPCGANRRSRRDTSNPTTNRSGVERLASDHKGMCLTLRSRLLSFGNSVKCDLGLYVCAYLSALGCECCQLVISEE